MLYSSLIICSLICLCVPNNWVHVFSCRAHDAIVCMWMMLTRFVYWIFITTVLLYKWFWAHIWCVGLCICFCVSVFFTYSCTLIRFVNGRVDVLVVGRPRTMRSNAMLCRWVFGVRGELCTRDAEMINTSHVRNTYRKIRMNCFGWTRDRCGRFAELFVGIVSAFTFCGRTYQPHTGPKAQKHQCDSTYCCVGCSTEPAKWPAMRARGMELIIHSRVVGAVVWWFWFSLQCALVHSLLLRFELATA